MRTVFLDLETTGLNPRVDEIVEIGVLDEDGQVLLDMLVRPVRHRSWPGAQRVHGIAPADVQEAPTLDELRPRIIDAVSDALVVIYNAPFDAGFLRFQLEATAEVCCAMREFAEVFGEWSNWHGSYRWRSCMSPRLMSASTGMAPATGRSTIAKPTRAVWWIRAIRQSGRSATREHERPSGRNQERSSWV